MEYKRAEYRDLILRDLFDRHDGECWWADIYAIPDKVTGEENAFLIREVIEELMDNKWIRQTKKVRAHYMTAYGYELYQEKNGGFRKMYRKHLKTKHPDLIYNRRHMLINIVLTVIAIVISLTAWLQPK